MIQRPLKMDISVLFLGSILQPIDYYSQKITTQHPLHTNQLVDLPLLKTANLLFEISSPICELDIILMTQESILLFVIDPH